MNGSDSAPKRLFVALPLPAPALAEVQSLAHALRRTGRTVRWVRPEHMHVTLRFLGDVEADEEIRLRSSLGSVTAQDPFRFNLAGVGAFPDRRRPRVIWVAIRTGAEQVVALAEAVEAAVEAAGFPRESRRFSPHVTIGRVREPGDFTSLWQQADAVPFEGAQIDAREVKLIHSTLTPQGPIYRDLESIPLRGGDRQS